MKKVFLSADIEGTCGIAHWDETLAGQAGLSPLSGADDPGSGRGL